MTQNSFIYRFSMNPIRVLLVDDNPDFLVALGHFLCSDVQIDIVGHSSSAKEALEKASNLNPDLVIMDLAMPEMNGLEATRYFKSLAEPPRIIILTLHENIEYRYASMSVAADGFVVKSELGVELLPLIHSMFSSVLEPGTEDTAALGH
ncbi:MAG: response regulator transcription factor [Anaerolineaceae bacterium]|nr:response regulator transcription factor [Anaerolineaceae bacterium]